MKTRTLLDRRSRRLFIKRLTDENPYTFGSFVTAVCIARSVGRGKLGHTILLFVSAKDFPVAAAKFPDICYRVISVTDERQSFLLFLINLIIILIMNT